MTNTTTTKETIDRVVADLENPTKSPNPSDLRTLGQILADELDTMYDVEPDPEEGTDTSAL